MHKMLLCFFIFVSFIFAKVDINKANANELTTLHGIGVKKATKIVTFREKNGCFSSIDDLKKVKGIGPKTLEKNRDNIILSECKN
jgi:competence protein ComEA